MSSVLVIVFEQMWFCVSLYLIWLQKHSSVSFFIVAVIDS